jgi:ATP-dependent helicase HrpB
VRNDLIVIVMSATLDAEPVAAFLGGCPIINVPGRTFPIEIEYARAPSGAASYERVYDALPAAVESDGDVLVFLPGVFEINRTAREIAPMAERFDLDVVPLHGSLPAEEQMRALQPSDRRKVILATNIAETSLTIEGVRVIIDGGLARVAGYDPQRGLDRLDLNRISKASARQRAGRAGRTAPGRCIRLYTEKEFHAMADFELPEIRRVDLAGTVLSLHAWGKPDARKFGWYDPPPESTLVSAENLLEMLGATENGKITPLGRRMAALPAHPRLARLLIAAAEADLLEDGAAMAAILSERDSSNDRTLKTQGDSDLLIRMESIDANPQIARLRDELMRIGRSTKPAQHRKKLDRHETLLRLALLAYPDRVCRRREADPAAGVMVGGGGVRLASESVVRQHEYFLALDARQDDRSAAREALVRMASAIREEWLEELFPQTVRKDRTAVFEKDRQRVVGRLSIWYRDLLLRQEMTGQVDPADAEDALRQAMLPRALELVGADENLTSLLKRLDFLEHLLPPHLWPPNWRNGPPKLDPETLVTDAAIGAASVDQLRANLRHIFDARLTHADRQVLDQHAPESILVPTGNRIALDWSTATFAPEVRGPMLAVRLQEIFGWAETPKVAGGRVPVVMHLLGPNFRPVQITDDLKSFWATTYFQVRKDLRVRYPKHSWPEDPLTAKPQAKGGRPR